MLSTNMILILGVMVLGTYIVATLDDLLWMKASISFMVIWGMIALGLGYYRYINGDVLLKVRVIIAVVLYVLLHFNLLSFKIATGDVIAMLPVVFLFPIWYVVGFIVIVLLFDMVVLNIIYTTLLRRKSYPFMPAILAGMMVCLLLIYSFPTSFGLESEETAKIKTDDGEMTSLNESAEKTSSGETENYSLTPQPGQ